MKFCSVMHEMLFFFHLKIMTFHDKMDSKKSDEEMDDSEEDENDFALDSSTSCESQWITQINLFTASYDISKSQIITIQYNILTVNDYQIRKINVFLITTFLEDYK